jgi:RNA polymerase sigma factor (sigma-70 family)
MAAFAPELEHLLRTEAPQVLGALVRRFGHFDIAEDAVQDALLAAAQQWPTDGIPDYPRGWLIRVGYRRMVDQLRADQLRQRREYQLASQPTPASPEEPAADDSLTLLFLCCHPILSPVSQVALTLRAVGGLTTAEIAHAYGVSEVAMGQRISRAKQQIRLAGGRFVLPSAEAVGTDRPRCCRCST